jgi:hypothetical protein
VQVPGRGRRTPATRRPRGYRALVDLTGKLQIKPGTLVAVVAAPVPGPGLAGLPLTGRPAEAGAVIAFARRLADLADVVQPAIDAARQDKLAWIAYPKAGQLGTDINRDSLARSCEDRGIRPVRQIAIDEVWSALRFRPAL